MTTETAETPAVRSGDAYTGSPVGCFHYSKIVREECRVARMKQRVSELWPSELLLMSGGTPNAGGMERVRTHVIIHADVRCMVVWQWPKSMFALVASKMARNGACDCHPF